MEVATAILNQLGGNKFIVMTGAKNLVADKKSLTMRLPKNESKANCLKIELTEMDEYRLTWYSIRNCVTKIIGTTEGIQSESLRRSFEVKTGMLTSL